MIFLKQVIIGILFYGVMKLTDAPNWACVQMGIIGSLMIEIIAILTSRK